MGQDISRDISRDVSATIEDIPLQPPSIFNPQEMTGIVVLRKRPDGSSIKELYIPAWNVAFYKHSGSIDILPDCTNTGGKPVKISQKDALLLYNAWLIYVESKRVLHSTLASVSMYLDSTIKQ